MKSTGAKEFKECFKVLTLIILITSKVAAASKESSSLYLKGSLQELVSISIKTSNDENILLTSVDKEVAIASLFEISNSVDGYLVKARSENNGRFVSSDGKKTIAYDLKYGEGVPLKLTSTNQVLSENKFEANQSSTSTEKFIKISLRELPKYSTKNQFQDFITFTIESR